MDWKIEEVCLYICQHSLWPCPLKAECWEVYVCWATTMHVSVCLCACSMCAGVNNECRWVDWRDTQRPIRALCPAWRAFCRNKYLQTQEQCSLSAGPFEGNTFITFMCLCRRFTFYSESNPLHQYLDKYNKNIMLSLHIYRVAQFTKLLYLALWWIGILFSVSLAFALTLGSSWPLQAWMHEKLFIVEGWMDKWEMYEIFECKMNEPSFPNLKSIEWRWNRKNVPQVAKTCFLWFPLLVIMCHRWCKIKNKVAWQRFNSLISFSIHCTHLYTALYTSLVLAYWTIIFLLDF